MDFIKHSKIPAYPRDGEIFVYGRTLIELYQNIDDVTLILQERTKVEIEFHIKKYVDIDGYEVKQHQKRFSKMHNCWIWEDCLVFRQV